MSDGPEFYFYEDRADDRPMDFRLLGRLLSYLRPHKGLIVLALLGLSLGTACQLAGPYIIKIVIDRHLVPGAFGGLGRWIILYLLSLAGGMGFLYVQMYSVSVLGQRVILAIRAEMFARLERLPVSFFDRTPTGRLMTRLTSDVEALQELISSGLVSTVGDVAVLVGIAGIMIGMNAPMALVTFAVLPPMVLFVEAVKRFIREANRESRRRLARLNAFLQEHVTGISVVKAFAGEEASVRRFSRLNDDYTSVNVRLTNYYSVYFPGVELFASAAVALLLWRGGIKVIGGAVTIGTLVAFLEYAQRFFNPIKDMSDKYNILQAALVACERIFHVLDTEVSPEYRDTSSASGAEQGSPPVGADPPSAPAALRGAGRCYPPECSGTKGGGRPTPGTPGGGSTPSAPPGDAPPGPGAPEGPAPADREETPGERTGPAETGPGGKEEGIGAAASGRGGRAVMRPPAVEFRDVWFSYPGRPGEAGGGPGAGMVLRGVSFTLEEGMTGAIVGATGAGKTTVLSLLCRFYEIGRGRILLFGKDIREMPGEELRRMISLVLQDPFLFSGTVLSNVAVGGRAAERAAAVTGVAAFARERGRGLDTEAGERGGRLSVGQRQLVAFARALARDPAILLLDEATSSVDPVTESDIQKGLAAIRSGRTSLVVAHRLSTVLSADRIIVMHKGRVRETGTHGELMEAGGLYRRLYMLQFHKP